MLAKEIQNFIQGSKMTGCMQVFSKDGVASSGLPEYVMCFQPPLIVHNMLPYEIQVTLTDASTQAEPPIFTIGVGGFVEVYLFDMSRKIRMSMSICMDQGKEVSCTLLRLPVQLYGTLKRGSE